MIKSLLSRGECERLLVLLTISLFGIWLSGCGSGASPPREVFQKESDSGMSSFIYQTLDLEAYSLVWSPATGRIYALTFDEQRYLNRIVAIDPESASVVASRKLVPDRGASKLALSADGTSLYVYGDQLAAIYQLNASDLSTRSEIPLSGDYSVARVVVPSPVEEGVLAVLAESTEGVERLFLFDQGAARPASLQNQYEPMVWNDSGTLVYTYTLGSDDLVELEVTPEGLAIRDTVIAANVRPLQYVDGEILTIDGFVYNVDSGQVEGHYPTTSDAWFTPRVSDRATRKSFRLFSYLPDGSSLSGMVVEAYDRSTMAKIDSLTWTEEHLGAVEMLRWGEDGLALRPLTGPLVIGSGSFVSSPQRQDYPDSLIPTAEGWAETRNGLASYRGFSIGATDVVQDRCRDLLYVSMSAVAPAYPNAVIALDPASGEIRGSAYGGSWPMRLSEASDCGSIYVNGYWTSYLRQLSVPSLLPLGDIMLKRMPQVAWARDFKASPASEDMVMVLKQPLSDATYCRGTLETALLVNGREQQGKLGPSMDGVAWDASGSAAYYLTEGDYIGSTSLAVSAVTAGGLSPGQRVLDDARFWRAPLHFDAARNRVFDSSHLFMDLSVRTEQRVDHAGWEASAPPASCLPRQYQMVVTDSIGNAFYVYEVRDERFESANDEFTVNRKGFLGIDSHQANDLQLRNRMVIPHKFGYPEAVVSKSDGGLAIVTSSGYLVLVDGPILN